MTAERAAPLSAPPRRILILGESGSGKTTLAWALAARLDAPPHDLDQLCDYGPQGHPTRPIERRLEEIAEIAAQPSWICAGGGLWWPSELRRTADLIVLLDLPWRTIARRIVVRQLKDYARGVVRGRGLRERFQAIRRLDSLRALVRLVYGSVKYYWGPACPTPPEDMDADGSRATTLEELRPYAYKVVRCRRPSEVDALVADLSVLNAAAAPSEERHACGRSGRASQQAASRKGERSL